MRLKALILSLCTMVYLVEFITAAQFMAQIMTQSMAQPMTQTAGKPATPKDCCSNRANHKSCPKSTKDCSSTSDCCLTCPFCSPALIPSNTTTAAIPGSATRNYPSFSSSYVYQYYSSTWKPPNAPVASNHA